MKNVINASDFLDNINDVSFNTSTTFNLPAIEMQNDGEKILDVDKFASFPFSYDGFVINRVLMRSGDLSFGFTVTPEIPMLKQIIVFSDQIEMVDGQRFEVTFNYPGDNHCDINLAGCSFVPDNDTVAFSAKVVINYSASTGFDGGDYSCSLTGGLTNARFNTVYGNITNPMDSVFNVSNKIDFGVNGLTGSCLLPTPKINVDYMNTFGFGAVAQVNELKLKKSDNTYVDLLADGPVELTVNPTYGEYYNTPVTGFTEQLDLLADYKRLDFTGEVSMLQGDGNITISDTSTVNMVAALEMPLKFKLTDLRYLDTVAVNFSGDNVNDDIEQIDDLFDEIDFTVEYNSKIKVNMDMQIYFLKNNHLLDSLFTGTQSILYSDTDEIKTIDIEPFTGQRLKHIMRTNKMVMKMGARTDDISADPVMMLSTDGIMLRMKMLTKSTTLDIDDIL